MKRSGPPQRRTPLASGKPLTRTSPVPRQNPGRVPKPRRPADTGPTASVKAAVKHRDGNACVICGRPGTDTDPLVIHHRRGRGAGGSSDPSTNRPSNLLAVHRTANSGLLEDATDPSHYTNGWKVHRNGNRAPADVPALYPDGRLYMLTDDARKVPA